MSTQEFQWLKNLTNKDLVSLLGDYVRNPALAEMDKDFIKAIQHELQHRKPEDWKAPATPLDGSRE